MSAAMRGFQEYLLNSLWQTLLLFGVAWLLARMLRRMGPAAEHRVWVGAMFAQCVLPACAAPGLTAALRHLLVNDGDRPGVVSATLGVAKPIGVSGFATGAARLGLLAWVAITALMLGRLLWQLLQLRRVARSATPLTLDTKSTAWLQACRKRWRTATVELASSASVRTPMTFGLMRPMLLLPSGFAECVSAPLLQAALSHELAHVARRDAAKQMLYRWISLPLQYHPVMWLTLGHVAETRERVCDAMAAEAADGPRQYAHALLDLASLLTVQRPAPSHAIGLFDANQFERRILMLNRRTLPLPPSLRVTLLAGSTMLAAGACTSALALHLNVVAPAMTMGNAQMKVPSQVMAGQVLNKVVPIYPPEAKAAKMQGEVVLAAIIGRAGTVEQLRVVSGPAEFHSSALDAVRQWVYKPYLLNGQPTEVETTVTIHYSLAE